MTFSPLLFADQVNIAQPTWLISSGLMVLVASVGVWIAWQSSNARGQDFFGPRDPRSDNARPWGQIVLLGFLSMILVGVLLPLFLGKQQLPADPASPERLAYHLFSIRWNLIGNLITLGLVIGWSYAQVLLAPDHTAPWIGLFPTWRDLRHGILLGVACVPLLYITQGLLQYILVEVYQQPRVEHPLIELVRKNKDADPGMVTELLALIGVSVSLLAPLLEELLFRGLLQGWVRTKYHTMTDKMLAPPLAVENIPALDSNNPYQASQVRVLTNPAELQRRRITTWAPIFIASLAFALAHVGHGPAPIPLFFFSLALGYVYEKTGRLAPSIIAHLMLNLTTTIMLWLMISGRIPAE